MKNKIIAMIVLLCLVFNNNLNVVKAVSLHEEIVYTNSNGVKLNKSDYDTALKYLTQDELDLYDVNECNSILKSHGKSVVAEETIFVKTESVTERGVTRVISETNLTEHEMERELLNESKNVSANSIETKSLSDRDSVINTSYKKITMHMNVNGGSSKTVSINCEWKKIPSVKSFDVIGVRPLGISLSNNYTASGSQKYDGNTINYDYAGQSDHFKITSGGIGMSTNISDSVKNSLSVTLKVNFMTNQDPFTVYGAYEHATSEVTLAQSKKYSIASGGMGNVFDFKNSVWNKYDNTPGLHVKGSLSDYF